MTSDARGSGLHVATVAHGGRIWDVYVEFDDDPRRPDMYRARLRFDAAGGEEVDGPVRTGVIIIENSFEEAVARGREFEDRQLSALLRSVLPDEDEG